MKCGEERVHLLPPYLVLCSGKVVVLQKPNMPAPHYATHRLAKTPAMQPTILTCYHNQTM